LLQACNFCSILTGSNLDAPDDVSIPAEKKIFYEKKIFFEEVTNSRVSNDTQILLFSLKKLEKNSIGGGCLRHFLHGDDLGPKK
jgi:hypothetical protein